MSEANVITFLRTAAARPDVLDSLQVQEKLEVIAAAKAFGLPFTEAEFNTVIWDLELKLAEHVGEAFDGRFTLWQTMWGKYYLEYVVLDLLPALAAAELV